MAIDNVVAPPPNTSREETTFALNNMIASHEGVAKGLYALFIHEQTGGPIEQRYSPRFNQGMGE